MSDLVERARYQKTSHNMTDEELAGADWQDGYDGLVELLLHPMAATIEALEARVKELEFAAQGGNAINSTSKLLRFMADRLINQHQERLNVDFIRAAYERADFLDRALKQNLPTPPEASHDEA